MSNSPLQSLISEKKSITLADYRKNLRDLIQKICLLGLWRGRFFEYAAFYGGTALRMMYGLDRFSEDLDFSLLKCQEDFRLGDYVNYVQRELKAWDISAEIDIPQKRGSKIESAFIKANTLKSLLNLKIPQANLKRMHRDEVSSVKFELDPFPPCPYNTEFIFLLEPIPFSICTMSLPDLFAGKMHAVLARGWQNRIKGRDWYDLIWFVRNKIALDLPHLEARLKQSGHLENDAILEQISFRQLLRERISKLDFENAKMDVMPFISNPESLLNWSSEMFTNLVYQIIIKA